MGEEDERIKGRLKAMPAGSMVIIESTLAEIRDRFLLHVSSICSCFEPKYRRILAHSPWHLPKKSGGPCPSIELHAPKGTHHLFVSCRSVLNKHKRNL
jgi:hypothetical protein